MWTKHNIWYSKCPNFGMSAILMFYSSFDQINAVLVSILLTPNIWKVVYKR